MRAEAKPAVVMERVGNEVFIHVPKGLLILSYAEFKRAWKRGKSFRRAEAMKARLKDTEV